MENQKDLITPLFEHMQEYGKTSYELVKLKTIDKIVRFLSNVATRSVLLFVTTLFLIFLSIGLAIWFGQMNGEMYLGFFYVAGFYGIVGGVLFLVLRKWMKRKFGDSIVNRMLNS